MAANFAKSAYFVEKNEDPYQAQNLPAPYQAKNGCGPLSGHCTPYQAKVGTQSGQTCKKCLFYREKPEPLSGQKWHDMGPRFFSVK